jgi:GTP cyclohydrolase I
VTLEDVQNRPDHRQLAIDEVGIAGLRYPVAVADREHGKQESIANIRMSVDLSSDVKGAHLSRFVEVLHAHSGEVSLGTMPGMLNALRERMGTRKAGLEVRFPYFLQRPAPVTRATALLDYDCALIGHTDGTQTSITLSVRVPVTSVCPCSKAISDYGAHNQRGYITMQVRVHIDDDGEPALIWVEELVEIAEAAASSPVFPLLKRPDERYVTMQAYNNPVFVEDMVRSVAEALSQDQRLEWFSVEAINDESIHNHAAYARIETTPPPITMAVDG